MFHVVLYEPEIPLNTGNIIRLCANTGASLHLVHPLGFSMQERQLRRAGLDYHELACVSEHPDLDHCLQAVQPGRIFAATSKGSRPHTEVQYQPGDLLLFGPETRGLPPQMLDRLPEVQRIRIPMVAGNRSLNLSNAVAVVLYEAWRQNGFKGGG